MSESNTQGWKLAMDICERKNNPHLFTVLVNLTSNEIDYYIYEYDILSERVEKAYADYLNIPKRAGGSRKDIAFRWFDLKLFTADDYARKNNWAILGF